MIGKCCLGSIETRLRESQVLSLWEFWRDELLKPDTDEQFTDWIVQSGWARKSDSGTNLELRLS